MCSFFKYIKLYVLRGKLRKKAKIRKKQNKINLNQIEKRLDSLLSEEFEGIV